MAGGRLGNCLIPPYSSAEIYHNNSGSSASISIATQVIDPDTNSEISTNIGTASTTLTATTTLTTGGCYCRIIGYNVNESTNCYYGAFSAPTTGSACTWSARYISSDGTTTVGFTTSCDCCIPIGGNEIINPTLRINCGELLNLSYSCWTGFTAILGVVPQESTTTSFYFLTKYNTPTEECAGKTIVNRCCNSLYSGEDEPAICCSPVNSDTFNYYALNSSATNHCICNVNLNGCVCSCNITTCLADPIGLCVRPTGLSFYYIQGTTIACCANLVCCKACVFGNPCVSINACCITFCVLDNFGCSNGNAVCCYCVNSVGCRISPFGVSRAMTKDVYIGIHQNKTAQQKYLLMPTNYCLYATGSCTCHNKLVDIHILHPDSNTCCELAIKYLSYNPNSDCVYIMSRSPDVNACGIFSINLSQLCLCFAKYSGSMDCGQVACIDFSATPLFCRVSDFPTAMTCSHYTNPFMCVSCLFRFASSGWSMSLYNCCSSVWDTFVTDDLINWCSTVSNYTYASSDTYQIASNPTCVVSCCNCFMANVDYSGMIDYKVSGNNYERTGVVISNGDRINVNNNSSKCMSAQVWGYEG